MNLFKSKERQIEKAFKDICKRADIVTEHTRNNIVRSYQLHLFTSSERQQIDIHAPTSDSYLTQNPVHTYLTTQGFQLQEDDQVEPLSEDKARLVLRKSLTDSVAYGKSELENVEPSQEADTLVTDFFSFITNPKDALYFSISSYFKNDPFFESGLIIADDEKLMYLWFEEQD